MACIALAETSEARHLWPLRCKKYVMHAKTVPRCIVTRAEAHVTVQHQPTMGNQRQMKVLKDMKGHFSAKICRDTPRCHTDWCSEEFRSVMEDAFEMASKCRESP